MKKSTKKSTIVLIMAMVILTALLRAEETKFGFGKKFVGAEARVTDNRYIGYGAQGSIYSYMLNIGSEIQFPKLKMIDSEVEISTGLSHTMYDTGFTIQISAGVFFKLSNCKVGIVISETRTDIHTTDAGKTKIGHIVLLERTTLIGPKISIVLCKNIELYQYSSGSMSGSIKKLKFVPQNSKIGLRYKF